MDNKEQIQRLEAHNDIYFKKIEFNNIKLMILRNLNKTLILSYIKKYADTYKDEEDEELLLNFLQSKSKK